MKWKKALLSVAALALAGAAIALAAARDPDWWQVLIVMAAVYVLRRPTAAAIRRLARWLEDQ